VAKEEERGLRNIILEKWEGNRYGILFSKNNSKYLLSVVEVKINKMNYSIIARKPAEQVPMEFPEKIGFEESEKLKEALYKRASEIALRKSDFYGASLIDFTGR